jgi:hypothetical protein
MNFLYIYYTLLMRTKYLGFELKFIGNSDFDRRWDSNLKNKENLLNRSRAI